MDAKIGDSGAEGGMTRRRCGGNMKTGTTILLSFACIAGANGAFAADKPPQFWNLTTSTVTKLEISKAGASAFGINQTANDPDGAVDHDERLKITGVENGTYDLRLTLKNGRMCLARNVNIQQGKVFSIEDRSLVDCAKK
jgi:hypothetical protein